jgi:uncharacterized protein YraI
MESKAYNGGVNDEGEYMRRIVLVLFALTILLIPLLSQDTGVTVEALGQANLRAQPNVDSAQVGEITSGTVYPVIGRSEFFPWVLLADPATGQPFGWVFQDLVTINGSLANVPISTIDVSVSSPPVVATADSSVPTAVILSTEIVPPNEDAGGDLPTATNSFGITPWTTPTPSLTPTINAAVVGVVSGEINVRYGPGTDYPPLGRSFAGERFEITGYSTQYPWLQVRYDASPNGYAWIAESLLEVTGNVFSLPAITNTRFDFPTLTPTPAVRIASSLPGVESDQVRPEFLALGDQMWNYVLAQQFVPETSKFGAIYLQDLQTGEAITYSNDIAFSGTSITKIGILLAYFYTIDGQPNAPEAIDVANTMICSENVATNRMLSVVGRGEDLLGAEETTALMRQLGLQNSFITAPYDTTNGLATSTPVPRAINYPTTAADQVKANPNPTNQLTVDEMGYLLSTMYQCGYQESGPLIDDFDSRFTPQECRKMLHVMSNNTVDGLLKAGVPADVQVAHKHGWIDDTHGNAGVFFTPGGDYVLVMMLHKPGFLNFTTESLPTLAEVSRMVYNFYNPSQPLTQVREGYIPEVGECNYTIEDPLIGEIASPFFADGLPQ